MTTHDNPLTEAQAARWVSDDFEVCPVGTKAELDTMRQQCNDLLVALIALLHAPIIYSGGGDEDSIDNAGQPGTEPLAVLARAAIARTTKG